MEGERAARLREIARRSAVLPTPLLPTRQTISPGLTKRAILLKTFTSAVARMEIRNLKERLHHRSIKDPAAERREPLAEDYRRCQIPGSHRGHRNAGKPRHRIASSSKSHIALRVERNNIPVQQFA